MMIMLTTEELLERKCKPERDAMATDDIVAQLPAIDGWRQDGQRIVRSFDFKDYHETLSFINAIAYVIHAEDHHPELVVTYNRCVVRFDTHSVNGGKGGLSINDFICAAKVNAIFQQSFS
jgi:4a-hydroxytetrahydrobiopterin dehydratase